MNELLKNLMEYFALRTVDGQVHRTKDEDRKRRNSHLKFKAQRRANRLRRMASKLELTAASVTARTLS